MFEFSKKISPHVQTELSLAKKARIAGDNLREFKHLENAHVLGQESTYHHTLVHCLMLLWGIRQVAIKEMLGQIFRILGAFTKTPIGLLPTGNTGGSNISPFKKLPLSAVHSAAIASAKSDA